VKADTNTTFLTIYEQKILLIIVKEMQIYTYIHRFTCMYICMHVFIYIYTYFHRETMQLL